MKPRTLLAATMLAASTIMPAMADAMDTEWRLCPQTTVKQVVHALHRSDIATLSRPTMTHGTCTSMGHLSDGQRIGVRVVFSESTGIGTSVFEPVANADPDTNSRPTEYPASR